MEIPDSAVHVAVVRTLSGWLGSNSLKRQPAPGTDGIGKAAGRSGHPEVGPNRHWRSRGRLATHWK